MSTMRKGSVKKVKALITGVDYAIKGAGIASAGLNAMGLCVVVASPIAFVMAGGAGVIFCCMAGCYEWQQNALDIERNREEELDKIEEDLEEVTHQCERPIEKYFAEHTLFSSTDVEPHSMIRKEHSKKHSN